jgi:hypothetical protein
MYGVQVFNAITYAMVVVGSKAHPRWGAPYHSSLAMASSLCWLRPGFDTGASVQLRSGIFIYKHAYLTCT